MLESRRLIFQTPLLSVCARVVASFANFNRLRYLTRITIWSPPGDTPQDPVSVGTVETGNEEVPHILGAEVITRLHVYCRHDGLCGLDSLLRNLVTSETATRTVGDVDTSMGDLEVAPLKCRATDSRISGLEHGFDVRHCP